MQEYKWYKLLLSLVACFLLGLPSLVLYLVGTPYQRGFYCDDDSIRYPHKGETMSAPLVGFLGFGVPLIGMILFEVWRLRLENKSGYVPTVYKVCKRNVHRILVRLYIVLGYFLIGAIMAQLIEDLGKYGVGRLRPYFLSMCKPDWSKIRCTAHEYVFPIPCTETDWFENKDMRMSFPSGHATFPFYGFVYFLLYIEARVYWQLFLPVLRPIIQYCGILIATGIGICIVDDYEHHPTDVIAGAILGSSMGIFIAVFMAKLFQRRELPEGNVSSETELEIRRGRISPLPSSALGV